MQLINDRYELLEVIASGGMATVWRARDTRLNRLVALKRPHPSPPGDSSDERLGREARAAASLNHPNLITVYDFGTDDTGPFLVMELVDGPTLEDRAGDLQPTEIAELGVALANALAVIHAAGIVHRDVKPANVIMSERGPLLTDFGIALDPNATAEITAPGQVVATPSYAAPEVLRGEPPTAASDVYSLGVMIDELFRKTGTSAAQETEQALTATLAPSPADRPTAAELAASLGDATPTAVGFPVGGTTMVLEATPTPAPEDVDPVDERRGPAWVWVAALLALFAVGLFALGVALSGEDPPAAATDTTPPTSIVADTSTTSTSTSTSTSSTTTTTSTTETSTEDPVAESRDSLEVALLEPPRSDLNRKDVEDLMKKVDEGIAAARDGDADEAETKLSEVARDIDDRVRGTKRDRSLAALQELADVLGVEIRSSDQDDDDDDD